MSIRKCNNTGKWGIGAGKCIYNTRSEAELAQRVIPSGSIQEMTISGYLQEMAQEEIKSLIDPNLYESIKAKDNNPVFKSFVIGHEGESKGKVIENGNAFHVVKKWVGKIIQMMHDKLKIGTKAFMGHTSSDNSHMGRLTVGEVVGKTIKKIKDKLSTVGIIYIKPEHRDKNLDIASIESGFTWDKETKKIKSLTEITGIALGDSKVESPGFQGATIQGVLQEFASKNLPDDGNGGNNKMNLDEIKKEIQASGYGVLDVFDRNDIDKIDFVSNYRQANKRLSDDKEKIKLDLDKFSDVGKTHQDELDKLKVEVKKYKGESVKVTSGDKLKEIYKNRNLNDQQKKIINKSWDGYEIQDPDNIETELNKIVDSGIKQHKEYAEIYGVKMDDKKPPEGTPPKEKKDSLERDDRGFLKSNPLLETKDGE